MNILPFGESALLLDLGLESAPDRARRTLGIAQALKAAFPQADIVPAAGTIALLQMEPGHLASIQSTILNLLSGHQPPPFQGQLHTIHTVYDGLDLDEIAAAQGTHREQVIEWHTQSDLIAELLGFLPGFAYLGPIDSRLVRPRRPSPRPRVAAGSVALAGSHTGIYPLDSPGGWNLIGRAVNTVLFDPNRDPPILLKAGDRVRFERVSDGNVLVPPPMPEDQAPPFSGACGIEVIAAPPGTTVQDIGRIGYQHLGFPPSGAQDRDYFERANRAVGNAKHEAALEIPLGTVKFRSIGRISISLDGEAPHTLSNGDEWIAEAHERAVRYLAIAGGFLISDRLGSKATLPGARFGGFFGRMLKRGDRLFAGEQQQSNALPIQPDFIPAKVSNKAILELSPGPHLSRFPAHAMDILLSEEFSVSALSNRVGSRLDGPKIPREGPDLALPAPMRRGAIQVTTDGTPIVLGPDHPITGGYPVPAMLSSDAQSQFARLRPGAKLRFRFG